MSPKPYFELADFPALTPFTMSAIQKHIHRGDLIEAVCMKHHLLRVALHPIARSTGEQRLCAALISNALKPGRGETPAPDDDRKKALIWIARRSPRIRFALRVF